MTESNVEASDVTSEKEIVIELDDNKDVKSETINEPVKEEKPKPKPATMFVERKQVVDLNDDEKALIVNNARNGLEQPYFDVKFFKNGKYRIIKKKTTAPTVSQKVITNTTAPEKEKKSFYTDNQILFEHIIELNAKVDKLMTKHKKLKRKYQSLQNDIYAEDEEVVVPQQIKEPEQEVVENKDENKSEVVNEPSTQQQQQQTQQHVYNKRNNWRSRLSYL